MVLKCLRCLNHNQTCTRRNSLIDYLQQTGIDANPVLITYRSESEIDKILSEITQVKPDIHYSKEDTQHKLWFVTNQNIIEDLIGAFSNLPSSYIADGHHRAAAASLYGIQRRKLNLKHKCCRQ